MELEPLRAVARIASDMGLRVVLIGALARQIVFDRHFEGDPYRVTLDIDAMVRVTALQEFEALAARLQASGEFRRLNAHKFLHTDGSEVDLIPFGGVANEEGDLVWPDGRVMSLDGLASADSSATALEGFGVDVRVVNLPHLIALKLFAYRDRHAETTKDIDDLVYILTNASDAFQSRLYDELPGEAIQELDYAQLGPYLLGLDVASLITAAERESLTDLLEQYLITPPDYRALSGIARGERLELSIACFEAFRSGLVAR